MPSASPTAVPTITPTAPPPPGVALGAFVNPNGNGNQTPTPQQVIAQTAQLETSMQRRLALHLHYFYWKDMKNLASNPEILDDIANGRVPVISWHCADDIRATPLNLIQIANGGAAADLTAIGQQLAALKSADGSAYPVMLRWFWEFNLNSAGGPAGNTNANGGCFVGTNTTLYPAQFINAWKKIYGTFMALTPRPNVAMVWNPNVIDAANTGQAQPYDTYYPAGYADWIGFDGYNKESAAGNPLGFVNIFSSDLTHIVTNAPFFGNKPILIGETASCDEYPDPNTQTEFLASAQTTLKSGISPWNAVSGLIYYNQRGDYSPGGGPCTWNLNSGLPQWDALSLDPYFERFVPLP